jgi:hypothetical protein
MSPTVLVGPVSGKPRDTPRDTLNHRHQGRICECSFVVLTQRIS